MKVIEIARLAERPENFTGCAVIAEVRSKCYYVNGILHREGGPALIRDDGTKYWLINGNHHREDGPAVEYPSGGKHWYLDGTYYDSFQDWWEALNPEQKQNAL